MQDHKDTAAFSANDNEQASQPAESILTHNVVADEDQ
jgi:hypothetical protein